MFALLAVWLVAIASPGPDVIQILRVGLRSRRNGVLCAIGIMTGNTVWTLLSVMGVGMLISTHPLILQILQVVGGCYLLYLGFGALRASRRPANTETDTLTISPTKAYMLGLSTNVSNPKALIFFISVFSQFVTVAPAWVIATVIILTGLAWFILVALAVRTLGRWLHKHQKLLDGFCGTIFSLFALVLLYEGIVQGLLHH
ncbi:MAG: LysE family translocator [Corynebacterium sp.]|nr:LysE family translocator [Corynebacterium sp.]